MRRCARAGVARDALLKTTIYVVARDRSDLVRVWNVVAARIGRVPSTLLGVSLLDYPEQLVEIEAVGTATRGQARIQDRPDCVTRALSALQLS